MYTPPPLVQALLNAADDGWRPTGQVGPSTGWIHPLGVKVAVTMDRHGDLPVWNAIFSHGPGDTPLWKTRVVHDHDAFHLTIPRSRNLHGGLDAFLHDLAPWLRALDLEPRRRIAQALAEWLVCTGQRGSYTVHLHPTGPDIVYLTPVDAETWAAREGFAPPPGLRTSLRADLLDLWQCFSMPDGQTYRWHALPFRDERSLVRSFVLTLPGTQHARMQLMAAMNPAVRDIVSSLPPPAFPQET